MATASPPALRVLSRLPILLLAILPASCAEATTLGIDRYQLVAIDGSLPGPIPGRGDVEATGGTLEVRTDDRVELTLDLRCRGAQGCTLPDEWRRMSGRLDRAAGPAGGSGLVRWSDGREATAVASAAAVELTFPLPPSQGLGTSVFRFE